MQRAIVAQLEKGSGRISRWPIRPRTTMAMHSASLRAGTMAVTRKRARAELVGVGDGALAKIIEFVAGTRSTQ